MEEESGDWQIINEGGKIVRRRVYTIPAPDKDNGQKYHGSNTSLSSAAAGAARKQTKKPSSKQQRMLLQMKAQQKMEKEQFDIVQGFANVAFKDQIVKYLKTIWILVTVGAIVLYVYAPETVYKWFFSSSSKIKLADRGIMTIYPSNVRVKRDLPLFYQGYAIAKPENEAAREAVKHVAALRHVIKDSGPFYNQRVHFHGWEHGEFVRQMRVSNVTMDNYCGKGFRDKYIGARQASNQKVYDDLLIWCFLARGHQDGFVKFEVTRLRTRITRGQKGVAIKYPNQNRIHSDSLLLLPIHSLEDLKRKKADNSMHLDPSTMVGYAALEWLRVNAGNADMTLDAYTRLFEEFLYEYVQREGDRWELWNAACTNADRAKFHETQCLVGTTCKNNKDDNNSNTGNNPDSQEEEEEEECCNFYDPKMKPFPGQINKVSGERK